ncbi:MULTISPECIES: chromophore lyase CpcT/CpeT [unclassified Aureispira]|uniref:chromophore lyase CpcT/CpeT n=1 Tax=unclassified Aureispira TaxID=2649989 RepID=UPI00069664BE|nr:MULTISPECIES: chromophore lyase CpcT/CpeT [unclassified Aureispira]WMX13445.1 chromophore lyase CpcT/CpeT [Aureispira sp. CCB-E]
MNHYRLSQKNSFSNRYQLGKVQFWVLGLVALFCLGATTTSYGQKRKRNKKHILPYLKDIKSAEEISEIYNKFDRLKYQVIGHFSNRDQVAAGTTTEPQQEFIVMPILKDRPGEFWVYLEFFSPKLIDAPMDQRVEQYVQVTRDSFRMEVYYLKNPKKYVNAWKHAKFPDLNIKKDLVRGDGCDLIIAHQEDKPGTFKTVPPKEINCEMLTAEGPARYVDLEFELSDSKYLMWFHFYNSSKEHLKKSAKNGLEFKRLKEDEMGHLLTEN